MLDIVTNEFRKLFLSMRFQIILSLGTLLFLAAGWASASRYEFKKGAYDELVNLERERIRRVAETNAWTDFVVQFSVPPSLSDLVFEGNVAYLPDVFGFNVKTPQRIHYGSSLTYNFALPKFNHLDWTFIVLHLITFGCLVLTFDSISGEREDGTLRLLASYSVPRRTILFGKHLATLAALMAVVAVGALASLLVFILVSRGVFTSHHFHLVTVWAIGSALLVSVYVALGVFFSTVCRSSSHSLYFGLSVWIVLAVGVPSTAQLVAGVVQPTRTASDVDSEISLKLLADAKIRGPGYTPTRSETEERRREVAELYNQQLDNNISQAHLAARLSKFSPSAILTDSLNRTFRTGSYRVEAAVAATSLTALVFSETVKRDSRTTQHPLPAFAAQWRAEPLPRPPWLDWSLLLAINLALLSAAAISLERSDL